MTTSSFRYIHCNADAVPARVFFYTPGRCQGQMEEVQYGDFGTATHDHGAPYRRVIDHSLGGKASYYQRVEVPPETPADVERRAVRALIDLVVYRLATRHPPCSLAKLRDYYGHVNLPGDVFPETLREQRKLARRFKWRLTRGLARA